MAKIFQIMDNDESTLSIAYLLLMANVLGLAVYLDSKKKAKTSNSDVEKVMDRETLTSNFKSNPPEKKTTQIGKLTSFEKDNERVFELASDNEQDLKKNLDKEKDQEKCLEKEQDEGTCEKDTKKKINTKDNIIDFKEAVASKGKERKQPLEPLVWRFPGD